MSQLSAYCLLRILYFWVKQWMIFSQCACQCVCVCVFSPLHPCFKDNRAERQPEIQLICQWHGNTLTFPRQAGFANSAVSLSSGITVVIRMSETGSPHTRQRSRAHNKQYNNHERRQSRRSGKKNTLYRYHWNIGESINTQCCAYSGGLNKE